MAAAPPPLAANNLNARRAAVGIDFTNPTQVFDRIQRDKRCFMETSYIKAMVEDFDTAMEADTKRVLGGWISLLEDALYLGEAGLAGAHFQGARATYRQEFNDIDGAALLTDEQKEVIKNDYFLVLPFLRNPPGANEQPLAPVANNNNNNNNNRTINNAEELLFNNEANNGVFVFNNGEANANNAIGGRRRRKQKTRKSKKVKKPTRKH